MNIAFHIMILGAALAIAGCAKKSNVQDAKLEALAGEFQSAMNGKDMISSSFGICRHLDQKLAKLEELVKADLADAESLDKFNKASVLWHKYREAEAEFCADLYRGGTMQPVVRNCAYSSLTQDRTDQLLELSSEMIYREDGQGGWIE